jgi:drug/metabolite transporter (DMT)-like permease
MAEKSENWNSRIAFGLLVSAAVLFGSTLIVTKLGTQTVPIFLFIGIRHLIALLCYIPLMGKLRQLKKDVVIAALITGSMNFLFVTFQTYGLQTTTAGKGGFITSLYVMLTPVLAWVIFKAKIELKQWIAIIISVNGLIILFLDNNDAQNSINGVNIGDILVFIGAIFCTLQIVFTGKFVKNLDAILFSMMQLFFIALFSFISSGIFQEQYQVWSSPPTTWMILGYLGIIATTLPLFFQNWSQKYIEPSRTALIFMLVPIFATIFGVILASETISWRLVVGGSLIIIGIIIASIQRTNKSDNAQTQNTTVAN